ncbi:spore germination protein GerPC [Bacillaceae bacterium W0354]
MYPPNNIWQQLAQLNAKLNEQNELIYELRNMIESLNRQLTEQSIQKPSAEKIEYNFDQLKIETLEGTLNIGLTPNQPLPFEQVDLPKEQKDISGFSPFEQSVYNQLLPYIKDEIPRQINQFSEENNIEIANEWKTILYHDLKKQLPNRIKEHIQQLQTNKRMNINKEQIPMLVEHIKKEINKGLQTYLGRIKENNSDESDYS